MPPRNITITLLGFAVLLSAVLISTFFPRSSFYRQLTFNASSAHDLAEEDLDTLAIALGRYHTANRAYPTTAQGLEALVARPDAPPVPANWSPKLDVLPLDPWDRPYVYEYFDEPENSNDRLDLYSLGHDGVASDDDIKAPIDL